ncbi:MAG TPA: caspase family protein [Gemmatimonadales bacterium]|nr:caspase family protein [Gemmatimonadales bacterium]
MAKRAFCVGINDYPYDGSDLNGCVNDARAWADLLIQHFDFPTSDVTVLTDAEATKAKMVAGLKKLLHGAKAGDVLVFTNSSHGSYVADTSGDEPTYDEVVCPYDIADNALADDELRELFAALPPDAHVVAIMDNCHSGTVTRAAISENIPGMRTPDDRRVRFLNPALRGDPVLANPWKAQPKRPDKYPQSGMTEVLLTGCTDKEYSYDALLAGTYHGAMTYHAIQAIREANYQLTYAQLHERLGVLIDEAGYNQHPQLEGKDANKQRQIFTEAG